MATVAFACSTCGKQFRVVPEQAGRKVRCPHCETPNSVPASVFAPAERIDDPPAGSADSAGDLQQLTASKEHRALPDLRYTHSRFARVTCTIAQTLLAIAILVLVYVLIVIEWKAIVALPLVEAIPIIAVIVLPSVIISITAVFLMAVAHCVEYLARIAAK